MDPFLQYVLLGSDVSEGVLAWISIGIDSTQNYTTSAAATWTDNGGVANANSAGGGMGSPPSGGNGTMSPNSTASSTASASAAAASSSSSASQNGVSALIGLFAFVWAM